MAEMRGVKAVAIEVPWAPRKNGRLYAGAQCLSVDPTRPAGG